MRQILAFCAMFSVVSCALTYNTNTEFPANPASAQEVAPPDQDFRAAVVKHYGINYSVDVNTESNESFFKPKSSHSDARNDYYKPKYKKVYN